MGSDAPEIMTKGLKTTTTVCPFCAVGCGMIVHVKDGKVVHIEGDGASPINRGSLCAKGEALFQVANNERRLQKVLYRSPFSGQWEEKSWDWSLDRIAKLMKETQDRTFKPKETDKKSGKQYTVNRTESIAVFWRSRARQRGVLSPQQVCPFHGSGISRASGSSLTLVHSRRSGGIFRTGSDDQSLERPEKQ